MSTIRIADHRVLAGLAKEVKIKCPRCPATLYVPIPSPAKRQQTIRDAINDHRRECVAPTEEGRVLTIEYPRSN